MLNQDIKSKISRLWDMFWAGGMSNPLTALEQISYLLFMRRAEDVGLVKLNKYKWTVYTQKRPYIDNLPLHMKAVFDYIKNLHSTHEPFMRAMIGANFEIQKESLLMNAIDLINEIYAEAERERSKGQYFQDTLGDFYEHILKQTSEAGKNGQFRTPRHIIQLMCEIVEPNINDTICDLTCGTSGFLVGAYQFIISKNSTGKFQIDENGFQKRTTGNLIKQGSILEKKLTQNTFFGYDVDATMIRLGILNLLMHNIKNPKIKHLDSLSSKFDETEKNLQFSIILANPPFTGRIDSSETSNSLKRVYAKKNDKSGKVIKQTIQSEILFLERIIQLLKTDGKAAVIVPEGVLFGSANSHKEIRRILLTDCSLDAVISLPSGVFLPYAGVKTSILVFTKKKLRSKSVNTKKVWFYGMDSDGYTLDTSRKELKEKPLPEVKQAYKHRIKDKNIDRQKKHFFVPISEIQNNNYQLSFNQYKEFALENQDFEEPRMLLEKLLDLEKQILQELDELNKVMS